MKDHQHLPKGYKFWAELLVTIDGKDYLLDELTQEQRDFVMTTVNVNGLNAAFAGKAEFYAEGLPSIEEVFSEIAAERESKRIKTGRPRRRPQYKEGHTILHPRSSFALFNVS